MVGQQYGLRTAFDDRGCNDAIGDIGERLGREYHRDVLLAQRLQPFADARGEQRVVEEDPGFVEDQQRRPSVEPLRSEEHTSELQSLMRISYAVFCLKKKKHIPTRINNNTPKTHILLR